MSSIVALADALPELFADLAPVLDPLTPPRFVVLDGHDDAAVDELVPDSREWIPTDADEQVLLVTGRSITALDSRWTERLALTVETASLLQDEVMDDRNAPWPVRAGESGAAEPAAVDGKAVWRWASGSTPVGRLSV